MEELVDGDLLVAIDEYIGGLFAPEDAAQEAAASEARRAGLPAINVSATEGRLLQLLVELVGARRILEIGTLGGYSAIWMARALPPDGRLISLEIDPRHAAVARRSIERAGLAERVEVRVGPALEQLATMEEPPFDLAFIDADKTGYPAYLDACLARVRPGGLILADNAIRGRGVLDRSDEAARAVATFNERVASDPRLSALILPVVRRRVDGLLVARVRER